MRPISLLTAALVIATLYALVFERDRLLAFAGAEPPAEATAETDTVAEREAEEAGRRVAVIAQRSEAQPIESAVRMRGRTEAAREVSVMAETSGRVISEPIARGAAIEAGDVLCELDPGTRPAAVAEARARIAEAEARLAEARINDRAARTLSEGGFASDTRVAGAEASVRSALAAVEAAQAGLAAAETELARVTIAAPFAGVLESDTAELGTLLQPGAPCASVIQLDPIRLVGFVPETDVARVAVGAEAGARLATGETVRGRVIFVSRASDEETRTFRVEVEVPNPELALRDGQTAEIVVASDGGTAHLLPASVLTLDDAGRLGVRVAGDGTARFLPVTVLRDTVDGVWLSGLPETVEVIVVGQEYVTDGVPVAVTLREPAP
ncbi:MAG: efflux RND transporter periplasmic adaptor subunit [Rhodobacteraceae bacterium]|jgi:multidrug efflux system membrane fusion protein|nr:efflux RND transporter periplasmic adaptor subunit [Paracoccaceae bacterium]